MAKTSFVTSSLNYYPTLFKKLGLYSAIDFCLHLPFRYEDQYHAHPANRAVHYKSKTVLYLKVVAAHASPKRMRWEAVDMFDDLQSKYLPPNDHAKHDAFDANIPDVSKLPIYIDFFVGGRTLNIDQSYFFYGELKYMGGYLQMAHPFTLSYRRDSNLVPIYSSTSGLNQFTIKQVVHENILYDLKRFCERNPLMKKGGFAGLLFDALLKRLNIHSKISYSDILKILNAKKINDSIPDHSSTSLVNLQNILGSDLPEYVLKRLVRHCGDDAVDALYFLHNLPSDLSAFEYQMIAEKTHPLYDLLKLYEYIAYQISLLKAHQLKKKHQLKALCEDIAFKQLALFIHHLPWELTEGQQHAWAEILEDLQKPIPMQRLLQGDVGSGKTVIALLASLYVSSHGQQVAIMAPTEILAQQLAKKCQQFLAPFGLKIEVLVGSTKAKAKREIKSRLALGDIDIIVGTHALIEDDVAFQKLGLIVIDEQHRFGVRQRLKLKQKYIAHELMMSATPIPRTLAMGLYAYLNLTTIYGLPANRIGIQTKVLSSTQRPALIQRLRHLLAEKAQIYWVCPLIEEKSDAALEEENQSTRKISDKKTLQNAQATYDLICSELPQAKVALLHGKIKAAEKNQIMNDFSEGRLDILVATTVIEVGVDVPNANVMIIEDATQFGLAQLHQLRGRVGRGSRESFCLLLYQAPIGALAKERLKVMQDTQNGFIIAQKDLELRGFGELLGQKQAGEVSFRLFDFARDAIFVAPIKEIANKMLLIANHSEKDAKKTGFDFVEDFIAFWLSKDLEIIQEQP